MDVVMIVPYYRPEITAIVSLADELALDLSKYGARVTVITGFPQRGIDDETRKEYMKRTDEYTACNIRILRMGIRRREGKNFFARAVWHLARTLTFYKAAVCIPADIFIIYSTPPLMGFLGAVLAGKTPVLYCLQDIFPDNLVLQGKLKESNLLFRLLRIMEDYIYRKVSLIATISTDMKQNLIKKKVADRKVTVIGNWADTEKIKRVERESNPLFDRFCLERDSFYVTYCGNLGYAQDIDQVLECAKLTALMMPDIKYIIIGNGIQQSRIKKRIREESIDNVKMFPLQPQEDSALVYSIGDVGLILLKKNMLSCSMPSKAWTMMAASLPIICTAEQESELYNIISTSKAGILVHSGNQEELKRAVISMYSKGTDLCKYGERGRAYALDKLQREKATRAYFNLLSKKEWQNV